MTDQTVPMVATTVGVAVVTYNSADLVDDFLDALAAAVPTGVQVRVVVADNASTDDTVERLNDWSCRSYGTLEVEVVSIGANLGYAAGINVATRTLGVVDAVLIANPDVRLGTGALAALLATASEPAVGVVVPRLTDERDRTQPSLRRDPSVGRAAAEALLGGARAARRGWSEVIDVTDRVYATPGDVDWATGALLLVTGTCQRVLGPWDESFFLYSEETEYLQRARRAGFRVRYQPAAAAYHRGGAAHRDPSLWALLTCNRVVLFARSHGWLTTALFWLAVLSNEVLRAPSSRPHRVAAVRLLALALPSNRGASPRRGANLAGNARLTPDDRTPD